MPNLRDFERRLGGLVEGLFSKTFRSGVQPVELAKRLIKQMDAGRTVGVNEVWAPNHFAFSLSPADHERLEHAEAAIARELGSVIIENASERGWGLVGPPEVTFEADEGLRKGDFTCTATLVEGPEKVEPAAVAAPAPVVVVREDGRERTVQLDRETATIGRLPECEVALKDRGASRRHAQISLKDGAATLTDLGSTNGTQVNGHTVQRVQLDDGDRITIGTTVLVYRSA
ncbi:MAG: FhaA domain-containing protein [Actinomycetota bacterium]